MKPVQLLHFVIVLFLLASCKMGGNDRPKPAGQNPPATAVPAVTSALEASGEYVTPNTYEVGVFNDYTVTWQDGSRSFKILVRYPIGAAGPLPLIVWSHGGGFVNNGHLHQENWGNALASAGYAVIHIAHAEDELGSHCAVLQIPANECEVSDLTTEVSEGGTLLSLWYDRPRDSSAVVDDLDNIERASGLTFDRDRIGAGGHSGGTNGAMSLAGAILDVSPSVHNLYSADPRFKAFLINSPQGIGHIGMTEHSWDNITAPVLIATGANDTSSGEQARNRLDPFKHIMPPLDKYLLYVDSPKATHSTFGLDEDGDPELGVFIARTGIAFYDAYLRGLPEALAWLNSNGMSVWSNGVATITTK